MIYSDYIYKSLQFILLIRQCVVSFFLSQLEQAFCNFFLHNSGSFYLKNFPKWEKKWEKKPLTKDLYSGLSAVFCTYVVVKVLISFGRVQKTLNMHHSAFIDAQKSERCNSDGQTDFSPHKLKSQHLVFKDNSV